MNKFVFGILGALLGFAVAYAIPGPAGSVLLLGGIIVGAIIGVILASVLLAQSRGEDPREVVEEVVRQATTPDPGINERAVREGITKANQALRLTPEIDTEVLSAFEGLFDLVLEVVPKAMELSPSSEMTYDLEKLGKEFLPKTVRTYLSLSPGDRVTKRTDTLSQIQSLSETLTAAQSNLDNGMVQDFETQHGFMELKFAN